VDPLNSLFQVGDNAAGPGGSSHFENHWPSPSGHRLYGSLRSQAELLLSHLAAVLVAQLPEPLCVSIFASVK
jgi:hypothetical protein